MSSFPYKFIDLTHTLEPGIPTWTGGCGFHQDIKLDYGDGDGPVSFRVQQLKMHAGIGTHMDAPAHCIESGMTIDQLALENLAAPCYVIDISHKMHAHYTVTVEDIEHFEQHHGLIDPSSIVMIYTGWSLKWSSPTDYINDHVFPSVSEAASMALLERQIKGLGIDTLSPDRPANGFPVHHHILGAGKFILENVANLNQLPPVGSFVLAFPLKTKGGTEAPLRLVGLIPE